MINWFTQAIAWDLGKKEKEETRDNFNKEILDEEERKTANSARFRHWDLDFTDLILGLQCLKNWRNLGIMMLRGLFKASLSNNSDESSQIFCSAPKEPCQKTPNQKQITKETDTNLITKIVPNYHCKAVHVFKVCSPNLAGVIVLRVEQVTELRQQLWPCLQLSFGGDGRDQNAFIIKS